MYKYLLLLCLGALSAQNQVQQLDEVILRAQRLHSPIQPLSLTVISDSLNLGLQQEVGALLQNVPSLFVSGQQNFTQDTRIAIRGFGSRAAFGIRGIKVLLDGVPITTPDGQTQLDHIPLSQLKTIQVVRGLSGGLYGNASGGVILLKSAPIVTENSLVVNLADFSSKSVVATHAKATQKNRYRAIVSHQTQKGYREWSAFENTLFSLTSAFDLTSKSTLKLDYSLFNSPFARDAGSLTIEQVNENRRLARQANKTYNAGERVFQHQLNARMQVQSWNMYAFYTRRELDARLPFSYGGQIDLDRDYFGVGLYKSGGRKNLLWQFGIESATQHDARQRFKNNDGVKGVETLDQNERFFNVGGYGMLEMEYNQWRLRASLRADKHRITVTDFFENNSGKKNLIAVSPSVALHRKLSKNINAYLRWGTGFETPSLNELSANPSGETGFNTTLNPQKSAETELGISFHRKNINASFTAFHTKTTNEITPYELEQFPTQKFYANIGTTTRKGIELEGKWKLSSTGTVHFSFSHGEYITESKKELPNIPQNQFAATFQQQIGNMALALHTRYVGRRFADSKNAIMVPRFWSSDLFIQRNWSQITLTLGVQNIANTLYFDTIRINAFGGRYYEPAATRQAFIRCAFSF